ncbi:MAG TPA: metalloregulator ArsR/SmtB family transcription factor [Candidatus Rubrimentiphilum sp.]|nr:metalloregulator ArsR/SmtB family transcription factor [Candidatus Rubrimentiphilum sp.]
MSAKYFRALGDPTRLRILDLLIEGPLTVTEMVDILRCPQSRVSNHLACLRWCGLVASQADGRWVTYSVTDGRVKKIISIVRDLVAHNAEHVAACTRIAD